MPIVAPAMAFSVIRLAAVSASAGALKDTGSELSRTARLKVCVAVLLSDDVAVTMRLSDCAVSKSSVPLPERVTTPVVGSMAKRGSAML